MGNATLPLTTTLWRPTGPEELALVAASDWREWPPRLPDQPIFYPVLFEDYAIKIARDWNVPASGSGYVTRFAIETDYLDRYDIQQAGGRGTPFFSRAPQRTAGSTCTAGLFCRFGERVGGHRERSRRASPESR